MTQRDDHERRRRTVAHRRRSIAEIFDDPEPHGCQQCHRAARGRFCYWCGKRRGLW